MKIFKFNLNKIGNAASKKRCVVILGAVLLEAKIKVAKARFPKGLIITERNIGQTAVEDCFNVLRIDVAELEKFNYNLNGCRAILVEGISGMLGMEAAGFIREIAEKSGLSESRIRLCRSMLSSSECNYSCYSAAALRDFAAEMEIFDLYSTAKSEALNKETLCFCAGNKI